MPNIAAQNPVEDYCVDVRANALSNHIRLLPESFTVRQIGVARLRFETLGFSMAQTTAGSGIDDHRQFSGRFMWPCRLPPLQNCK